MINGTYYKNALISGANNIIRQKEEINSLNIFPVPDGDTGTNMSMTIEAAAKAMEESTATRIDEAASEAASAMLNPQEVTRALFCPCCSAVSQTV